MKFPIVSKLFSAVALTAAVASAQPNAGQFGIGYDGTLGDIQGLSLRYQFSDMLGLQGIVFGDLQTFDNDQDPQLDISLGLRADIALGRTTNLLYSAPIGINWRMNQEQIAGDVETDHTITFELPLKAEWFPAPNLSLHGDFGLLVQFPDEGFRVGTAGDLLAGFGVTIWMGN